MRQEANDGEAFDGIMYPSLGVPMYMFLLQRTPLLTANSFRSLSDEVVVPRAQINLLEEIKLV